MKKLVSILMALVMLLGSAPAVAEGSVSTDGSTSMEKVIGALGEYFTEENKGVNFTYNPTGSAPASPPFWKAAATSAFPAAT